MIILLLIAANSFAAGKDAGKAPTKSSKPETTKQVSTKEKENKAPVWPRPYKSSEEISVDSTVPFPTDI
jgi:hypothetical protein